MNLELIIENSEIYCSLKPWGFDGDRNSYDSAIIGLSEDGRLVYSK